MGCDINAADGSGLTPLIVATIYDQCAVLHALVALGADVNLQVRNSAVFCRQSVLYG